MILAKNDTYGYMGKGNYASNIRKLEKSYKSGLTKPNMEGGARFVQLTIGDRQKAGKTAK